MNTPSFAHSGPQSSSLRDASNATIEDIVRAQVGDLLLLHEDDFHGITSGWVRVGDRKTDWVRAVQNGSTWVPVSDRSKPGEEFLRITKLLRQDRRMTLSRPRVARGKAKKDVGHGGLDEWFSGHGEGKGKAKGEATWGDWVAISPVKKKVERELADGTVKEKTVQPGDIVGPCGVSADPNWKDVTRGGKDPLKCMPRQKAHDMPRKERAELAKEKMRVEREEGNRGKAPTRTPTFEKEASDAILAGDNEPTKPSLWEESKADAKDKYTKWPSAYAVGHALKLYKERGGGWRKKSASLSTITFSGPHDAIKAHLATSGVDPVYFAAEAPNPRYDPDDYYTIRGVKKWWEKPTIEVAHLVIDLTGGTYWVAQAWTNEGYRRQGIIRKLYDMAWDYAKSKGKGFQSGWVQSPLMARYWEGLVDQDKAESYTDEHTRFNTTGKGWRRIRASVGKHTLPKLPYAYDALEPHISEETLRFHHDKHHKAYVDGLNDAERAIAAALKSGDFEAIPALNAAQAFNAGGHVLHTAYWESLTPDYGEPSDALVAAVERDFGSWDAFRSQMKESTIKVRGSGWGVLVLTPDGMRVLTVMNHENGVLWDGRILLPIDAWEHAYYLDYQNDRAAHFDAVFDELIDWSVVERRLKAARGGKKTAREPILEELWGSWLFVNGSAEALGEYTKQASILGRGREANVNVRLPATVLYDQGRGGWEYDMGGFANWPEFLRTPKAKQVAWAKDYVGTGINEPVEATVYADGHVKFEDGHHRVLAGALLGIEIPVKLEFRNFDPALWPELYTLLKAGYTHRQYNPQQWKLNRSGVPPLDVVRHGPDAADEWIMSNERHTR